MSTTSSTAKSVPTNLAWVTASASVSAALEADGMTSSKQHGQHATVRGNGLGQQARHQAHGQSSAKFTNDVVVQELEQGGQGNACDGAGGVFRPDDIEKRLEVLFNGNL